MAILIWAYNCSAQLGPSWAFLKDTMSTKEDKKVLKKEFNTDFGPTTVLACLPLPGSDTSLVFALITELHTVYF